MDTQDVIVNSSIKELYVKFVIHFRKVCEKYQDFLKYVNSTILDKVKGNIFYAQIDQDKHFRNTTPNIVKYAHTTLKNWMRNNKSDLCRDYDYMNQMIQNQHNEIKALFGCSTTMLEHRFRDNNLFLQLVYAGLSFIYHETKRAKKVGSNSSKCGCTLRNTYNLPCACLILKKTKLDRLIRMDEVYSHLKRPWFDDDGMMKYVKSNISIMVEWGVIQERFFKADDNMKLHIKQKLRNVAYP